MVLRFLRTHYPKTIIAGLFALFMSFSIRLWPFELLASQAPLILTLLSVAFVVHVLFSTYNYNYSLRKVLFSGYSIASLVLIVVISVGLVSFQQSAAVLVSDPTRIELRYGTYNKLYTNQDLESAATYLQENRLDIVSLQEIYANEVDYYRQQLGFDYSDITTSAASASSAEIGIISRYPIVGSDQIDLDNNIAVLRSEVLLPGDRIVAVYSVHIRPPFSPGAYTEGNVAFDLLSEQLAAETLPILMAGDFNTTIFSPKFTGLYDSISDGTKLAQLKSIPDCSWFGITLNLPLCMRIDHVFYDNQFSLVDVTIAPSTGSDHRIVTAILQL